MKQGVLTILMLLMLFTAVAGAEESESFRLYPYDSGTVFQKVAVPQPLFDKQPFNPFKMGEKYLKFLDFFGRVEYGFERETCPPRLEEIPHKPAFVARIKLFDKPVYLSFSVSR